MVKEYKRIVLLKGLECINKHHFSLFKSLLARDLSLEIDNQEKYSTIQIANMMEENFQADAGLGELIEFCEKVPALRKRAEILKKERSEVTGETSLEKNGQEAGPATPTSTTSHMLASERGETSATQEETSTAQARTSTDQTKRKQITKSEGGKKKKLTQEQAQLSEPLGTDRKKDEDCLQTPLMPPPTPPSSSSDKKQKNTTIAKHGIIKTRGPQEIHQLVEFSSSSNFPAVSELPTFEGLSAIPLSSLQSSQKPLEAPLDLKMSPSSSRSPCHNLSVSLSSDSNVHLNSNAHSIQSSGAQVPHVPSATGFSNVRVPLMPSKTVSCSSIAPHMSLIKVPSSIQDLHLPTQEAFSITEDPHNQAIASKNLQTTKMPPTTLTSKAQLLKMPSPATSSSSVQVSHTLATVSRSTSVKQILQTTRSSSIQILNSATVKASKNVQASQVSLPTEPNYFQASVAPPSATPSSSTSLLVPLSKATSRAQSTQIHPETESICVQAHCAPPSTVSRNKCTTQLTQGAASGTGKAFSLPEVKASMKVQAPQVSSPTAYMSILNPNATPPITSSNLLAPHATSSTASSSLLAPHATLSTTYSILLVPYAALSTASSNILAPHATSSTAYSNLLAPQATLSTPSSSLLAPHATLSTASSNLLAPQATLSTASSNLLAPHATLSTASSNLLAPHATLSTASSNLLAPHATLSTASSNLLALHATSSTASSNRLAPQATLSTPSSSLLAPHATLSTTSSNLLAPHATSSTASSNLLAPQATLSTPSSSLLAPHATLSTTSSNLLAPHATSSTAYSNLLAPQATLSTPSSSLLAPHATLSTTSSNLLAPHATLSTAFSTLLAPHATLPTASSNLLAPQLCPVTASRALSATPVPSATVHSSPSWTPRRGTVPKEPSREEGHHQGPRQVMVLKVTEPFTYDLEEDKRMFHATVATETEFFRVKVFDTALISKFIPRNIIAISDYFGCNGFLEIYRASCVSDVNVNPTMVISNTLRQRANATPKISYLFSQAKGTFVSGEYLVIKKTERNKAIYYGVEDSTGKMEVMVYGRLTNITCEPGNKLRLVCFELNPIEDGLQLKSVRHSYVQVINARR